MGDTKNSDWSATEKDRRNQRLIVTWSLAWVLAFLAADYAIEKEWIEGTALTLAATIGVTTIGLGAFRRFLRDGDELMRKIQLDALALSVGVGFVAGFSYSLFESAGIVAEAEALSLVLIMILTYIVSVVVGQHRCR